VEVEQVSICARGDFMAINKLEINAAGVKKALKNFTVYDALAEYIWNGFDAKASIVKVDFLRNEYGGITGVKISDNGQGISKNDLPYNFKKFNESNKATSKVLLKNSSETHGKDGVGRFSFFTFSNSAEWVTVYELNKKRYSYSIKMEAQSLEQYDDSDIQDTNLPCGTTVVFNEFYGNKFTMCECKDFLMLEFAWFLELNSDKQYSIVIDGEELDYSSILVRKEELDFKPENSTVEFKIKICQWERKLNEEYSTYYYINSNGCEEYKETTKLNQKGDKFYHSVFIKSSIFNNFRFEKSNSIQGSLHDYSRDSTEYKSVMSYVDNHLRNLRNPFIKEYTHKYISDLKTKGAYPSIDPNSLYDKHREEILDETIQAIYIAEPKIFSSLNLTQQKTLVRLFDMSMQSGVADNLYHVLESILDMDSSEMDELADLLKYTNMSNVTRTIALIKDRLLAINDIKQLVLNSSLNANEVDHLQKVIERHYWLFGEQYHLVTAEEPDFEEALRRFTYILNGEATPTGMEKKVSIDHPDKNKEMDIFAVQKLLDGSVKKSIVVELKHPKKKLGSTELQQVKTYLRVITNEPRFNSPGIEWVFYLVGNSIGDDVKDEIESNKTHGEPCLAHKIGNKKIFVKTWSDIFTEHEINYQHIQEKLLLQKEELLKLSNAKEPTDIVERQVSSTAVRPSEVVVPKT